MRLRLATCVAIFGETALLGDNLCAPRSARAEQKTAEPKRVHRSASGAPDLRTVSRK